MASLPTMMLALILFVRLLAAVSTSTFFQPDEFFQSLEVAHRIVFGYGHLTWEWTADASIRSPIYPALYIPVYALLKCLRLDDTFLLILLPKVLNGLVASLMDISLYILTERVLGRRYVDTAMLVSFTSFFNALSLTRSLSNSLETSLTAMAFSYFAWEPARWNRRDSILCLLFAALACCVRPTNAVIWVYAFTSLLYHFRSQLGAVKAIITDAFWIGGLAFLFLFAVDSLYYGTPTSTPLNFIKTNLRVASFYGVNQWHFYLSQALPLLCTTSLPFVIHGIFLLGRSPSNGSRAMRTMLGMVLWTIHVYSLGSHKEWRFLHPVLSLLHVFAAKSLVDLSGLSSTTASQSAPSDRSTSAKHQRRIPLRRWHLALLLSNVPLAYYVLRWHGAAQIGVMHYLRGLPPHELDSLGFLMPCHSTPWQAYLHRAELAKPGRMWAIGCEPPSEGEDSKAYRDQSDVFYADPPRYIEERFPAKVDVTFPPSPYPATQPGELALKDTNGEPAWKHTWPRYLVVFGALLNAEGVRSVLERHAYTEVWVGVNGWEEDPRRRGGVHVWKWTDSSTQL